MCEHHNDAWTPGRKGEETQERSNETAGKTRLRPKNEPGREAGGRDRWGKVLFLSEEAQLGRRGSPACGVKTAAGL